MEHFFGRLACSTCDLGCADTGLRAGRAGTALARVVVDGREGVLLLEAKNYPAEVQGAGVRRIGILRR